MNRVWVMSILCVGLCGTLLLAQSDATQAAKDRTIVETLLRLKGVDVNSSPNWKAAATRHLDTVKGTPRYVELVEKLKLRGVEEELLRLALEDPASTLGAKAAVLLAKNGESARLAKVATGGDELQSVKAIAALGNIGDDKSVEQLKPIVVAADRRGAVKVAATRAIGVNRAGQQFLLELAVNGQLPMEVKFAAANILLSSADERIRREAAKHLTLPATANAKPLPPVVELLKMTGDPVRGKTVFLTTGTCAKCHKVRGEGKDVGPDLSEIGSKLTRDAQFVSILDPSAGISHNFESYVVATTTGTVVTGVLVSRTEQAVTLRTAEAIDKEIAMSDIEEMQKSAVSIMPADLQKLMSVQELVDVVEYLMTLKKPM